MITVDLEASELKEHNRELDDRLDAADVDEVACRFWEDGLRRELDDRHFDDSRPEEADVDEFVFRDLEDRLCLAWAAGAGDDNLGDVEALAPRLLLMVMSLQSKSMTPNGRAPTALDPP